MYIGDIYIYIYICLSIRPSVHPSVCLSIQLQRHTDRMNKLFKVVAPSMFLLYFWCGKEIIGHCSKIANTIDLPNSQLQPTWFSRLTQLYCGWSPDVNL